MKKICFGFCLFISSITMAQKGVDGMVQTEKNFAAYAVANGTKDAFLKYADGTGVVFEKGEPVNAVASWSKRAKRPGILNWRPRFAEVASSGDLGYTTGPWTFQPKTTSDSIVASGRFFTVWHLDKNGEWHFLADLGLSDSPIDSVSHLEKIKVATVPEKKADTGKLLHQEAAFLALYTQSPKEAYSKYLSSKSILSREKMDYATNPKDQAFLIESFIQPVQLTPLKAGIASSGDLGYVYGQATLNGKRENYLHIWRREAKGWKLALELIQH